MSEDKTKQAATFIDINESSTKEKHIIPNIEFGNMCLAVLDSVEFSTQEIPTENKDGNAVDWEYAGKAVPQLIFKFKNYKLKAEEADRVHTHIETFKFASKKKDGTDISDNSLKVIYSNYWKRLKHFMETFNNNIPENITSIASKLFSEKVIKGKLEDRLKLSSQLLEAIAVFFNTGNEGKPIFSNVRLYIKLVADANNSLSKGRWLTFPTFVNEGFIEKIVIDKVTKKPLPTNLRFIGGETVATIQKSRMASTSSATDEPDNELDEETKKALGLI